MNLNYEIISTEKLSYLDRLQMEADHVKETDLVWIRCGETLKINAANPHAQELANIATELWQQDGYTTDPQIAGRLDAIEALAGVHAAATISYYWLKDRERECRNNARNRAEEWLKSFSYEKAEELPGYDRFFLSALHSIGMKCKDHGGHGLTYAALFQYGYMCGLQERAPENGDN